MHGCTDEYALSVTGYFPSQRGGLRAGGGTLGLGRGGYFVGDTWFEGRGDTLERASKLGPVPGATYDRPWVGQDRHCQRQYR